MVSANYIGSMTQHVWTTNQINPAVYSPGATTGNTQARRVLNLQNPAEGNYYASIQEVDDDGTSNYNGVLMSVQRRRGNGLSIQAQLHHLAVHQRPVEQRAGRRRRSRT